MKAKLNFNFFDVFVVAFILSFSLLCFYPLWYVLIMSVTHNASASTLAFLPPLQMDFTYYAGILQNGSFFRALMVTVTVTISGTALALVVTSSMAYGVSKAHIKGMKFLNVLVFITMYFSGGLIPTFFLYRDLGLLNNMLVMILPGGFVAGYFVIMRNYFAYSVPQDLEEAARIDGANDVRIYFSVIMPLSRPMIAAIGLFIAVLYWNNYTNYIYFASGNLRIQPLMYALYRILNESAFTQSVQNAAQQLMGVPKIPAFSLRMASIILSIVPILIVYPFLQKHFAKGILIGAVKG